MTWAELYNAHEINVNPFVKKMPAGLWPYRVIFDEDTVFYADETEAALLCARLLAALPEQTAAAAI